MITLKEQQALDEAIIREALEAADIDNLANTFRKIEDLLGGLSDVGREAMGPVLQAVQRGREMADEAATTGIDFLASRKANKAISQLLLLQSTLVQLFNQLPKIMSIAKGGLDAQVSRGPYESVSLRGRYLAENRDHLTLQQVLILLEQDTYRLDTLATRLAKQSGVSQISKGGRWTDEMKTFYTDKVLPAAQEAGLTGQGRSVRASEEQAKQIHNAVLGLETERAPTEADSRRRTSRATTEEEVSGPDAPMHALLRGEEGGVERAKEFIVSSLKPKGFFDKLKSAVKGGEGLPLGLSPDAVATAILSLPFKDFTRLVDNAGAIKIQMDADAAEEVAQQAETGADTSKAGAGRGKVSVSKLGSAMDKRGLSGPTKNTVMDFFRSLVGRGPIEFSE